MDKNEQLKNFSEKAVKAAGSEQSLLSVSVEIRDELRAINKRQARSDRKTGLLTIVIAVITVYVSIATGYIDKEVAQEHLNGFFDILFWWMKS